MTRAAAIDHAEKYFDTGTFTSDLARRVAIPTESQNLERVNELRRYIEREMKPALEALGFRCRVLTHPKARGPFLFGERIEDPGLPTVFGYGHGDVIRGLESGWNAGLGPWQLSEIDGRYYGRGVADNKGRGAVGSRAARLQLQMADRDGRGDRFGRTARAVHRIPRAVRLRRPHRLRRSAVFAAAADHVARHPWSLPDRSVDRPPRGGPPLRQLGWALVQSGNPALPCALDHRRADRPGPRSRI